MNYELKKIELKNGKFHYKVVDESGNVISERKSNRDYVACTTNGALYFGRLDLIGKGEHGRLLNLHLFRMNMTEREYQKVVDEAKRYDMTPVTLNEIKEDGREGYERLNKIAYIK